MAQFLMSIISIASIIIVLKQFKKIRDNEREGKPQNNEEENQDNIIELKIKKWW